jgi:hypothetical protein
MSSAYTVLWTRDRCLTLQKAGDEGKPLHVLFGGIHQSAPSLKHAGIRPRDLVFPITVLKGTLYVLAGVVIDKFVELAEYAVTHLGLEPHSVAGLHEYQIKGLIEERCGHLGHRQPYGCGIEVALAATSTPLRFDRAVAPGQLEEITFCPRRGAPLGLKHIKDGKLASSISLQGNVRRLCAPSATLFVSVAGMAEDAA